MDRTGLQFRLFCIFMIFSLSIVVMIGVVQVISVYRQTRQDTLDSLSQTARNISATYGTSAYNNAIRSVIYQGEYRVRTITEDGEILLDTSDLSVYISWPDMELDVSQIVEQLKQSDGTLYLRQRDADETTWIVCAQVLASWDGVREILLITKNTQPELVRMRQQIVIMLIIAAAILIISFPLSWYLAKSYLKPIQEITGCAEQLAKEQYDVEFPKSEYTEIATLSDTLKLAADAMLNYEKNRRDMIANVSHDMRTPLTMIKAYAEMIKTISGDNPEKRNYHLDVIISQSDRLTQFVNQTLELSRLQSRTLDLNRIRFLLSDLLRSVRASIQALDQNGHDIRLFTDGDTAVYADADRVEQLVINLVNNSLKYGGKVIDLRATQIEDTVRLEVVDYGEGIPREQLPYIWTKYYRIKPYGNDGGNAGVGLSIVKEIADMHGIAYGVDSEKDHGARFWFDFPYAAQK